MDRLRIKKLRDHLARLPDEKFDLSSWFTHWSYSSGKTNKQMLEGSCGSAACIAGHALALFAPDERVIENLQQMSPRAADLLGLEVRAAEALFEPDEDSEESAWGLGWNVHREDITRQQAVLVLDHLIATGEVDWRVAF